MAIQAQILYSEGCEHAAATRALVRDVAQELGLDLDPEMILVEDEAQARNLRYWGSPTVRINGRDIDPGVRQEKAPGFS
jgi:hypothetical protein